LSFFVKVFFFFNITFHASFEQRVDRKKLQGTTKTTKSASKRYKTESTMEVAFCILSSGEEKG
jgi:hypothetical protein